MRKRESSPCFQRGGGGGDRIQALRLSRSSTVAAVQIFY